MATNFPTSVDNFTNPTANDSLNLPSHSTQHANANDAIEAVETWLVTGASPRVVSTTKVTGFTTNSTSMVDVTDLSATITPRLANSKILVMAQVATSCSSTSGEVFLNLVRGSTNINLGSYTHYSFINQTFFTWQVPIMFLDSPATTSAVTYKIQVASNSSGNTVNISRNAGSGILVPSSITLIEVAA
jgi:hypothetical protein